ncbi:acryloyl-CoA reductase [Granulicatella sp. zg-ZJ]|uniref:YhdH/YhfP family quinone oxidoreductase n=1 Tax=Granulicatella sp. zg-ZJ TaxID=2678504 RepID=UPI0013D40AB3|nr:YhdH/YhfP family quinone oxidoreductase [Granulicatella sp. zg-ZJ]MBS4750770.1 YhdH/YhfP family quinone oxidoreductase [Carnobacteriaceae bacterium zg-ZUI78]NEW63173.1 acryloyl-CoA reductase [Granulicatella sp. zg-ZJ]
MTSFKAIQVEQTENGVVASVKQMTQDALSNGEVEIKVAYSSLNYKDMLACQTNGGVIRHYPMIPGIDFSGIVVKSESAEFVVGDKVFATGFDIGMTHTGGLSEYVRVPAKWLLHLPQNLSLEDIMVYGTAGLTAALCVAALERNGLSVTNQPNILVTGASGGVGSIALSILSKMGFKHITALVRKSYQESVVKELGAANVLYPENIDIGHKKLAREQFHFVIDTVGGDVLSQLFPQVYYNGCLALCGNAGGVHIKTNVLPFILRGIAVVGIDSVQCSMKKRQYVWEKLSNEWYVLPSLRVQEVSLENSLSVIEEIKNGQHTGRTVVRMSS